jgi:hypothetical protein
MLFFSLRCSFFSFLHTVPLKTNVVCIFLCLAPLTPQFGLKSMFPLHVGLNKLSNMTHTEIAVPALPPSYLLLVFMERGTGSITGEVLREEDTSQFNIPSVPSVVC